eukprot:CAMPEP_0196767788 /NCGR_PEP_ID=MMETSP1095-20130614/41958_1 /TAXON_ID=96789 ORGANISM="Chromulina nebulosa, Strain UTEXLB2642" /NCGR_SAMPLE_ID=MMETSP1095 /ASSEMBLY_ACC=CAM_ASM_000446 /LENGTH=1228 /DNA_ID=CAMNT_0042136439 /DNA_START=798 /DNA_END=4481 /DNA_ORIENTATION=+
MKDKLLSNRLQLEEYKSTYNNTNKYDSMIKSLNERIEQCSYMAMKYLEEKYTIKQNRDVITNRYTGEGVYVCQVSNRRGGSIIVKRSTRHTVVVAELAEPCPVTVFPFYFPRSQGLRKRWTTYTSLLGTFRKGKVEGIVVINYADGSFYEGPYVGEEWLDKKGHVRPDGRVKNHYGVFKSPDGRIFEGALVDNHFDIYNLQSSYKVTNPDGEIYEGQFCDELYHGLGVYYYADGSVYEGQWHRGLRFGHGHYRSSEGWTYEGYFDSNRRHRQGCITWADGSMYVGDWYYDEIQGKGMLISKLRDVYKGTFVNAMYDGKGEINYGDGSKYTGEFKENRRHGRGIYLDKNGTEYYGTFVNDEKDGEFIVKVIIEIEEVGQPNYEIKIALYDNGEFIRWKSKFSNENATNQFIKLFRQNRDMFDSVYAMIVARNLPNLPEGIDAKNKIVQEIIIKIRNEAGSLVDDDALIQAKKKIDYLLVPIHLKQKEIDDLKSEIESTSIRVLSLDHEVVDMMYKFNDMMADIETQTKKMNQTWADDPLNTKQKFEDCLKALRQIKGDEFFKLKNKRIPPLFTKKIMDCVCILLGLPLDWQTQRLLLSDSVYNSNVLDGDKNALRFQYDCKFVHMMESYDVINYLITESNRNELEMILADPRFRYDSYYIKSLGVAAIQLVKWVKANNAYVLTARSLIPWIKKLEKAKVDAARLKSIHVKKIEELNNLNINLDFMKRQIIKQELLLGDMKEELSRANYLLKFVEDSFAYSRDNLSKADYYMLLEQKLVEKRDEFEVRTSIQSLINGVVQSDENDQLLRQREAISNGKEYKEPEIPVYNLNDWIDEEIKIQQETVLATGYKLGYNFEPEDNEISFEMTLKNIILCSEVVIGRFNDALHAKETTRAWKTMTGKSIKSRFMYVLMWNKWKNAIIANRDNNAVKAWEEIFGSTENCARMAIEARVNNYMSNIARKQAEVWASRHAMDISMMEQKLSNEFIEKYNENSGQMALVITDDNSGKYSPAEKAQCVSYIKLNRTSFNEARDERSREMAAMFETEFPEDTMDRCFKILNGIASPGEMLWITYADHWKSFHLIQYEKAASHIITSMASDFIAAYRTNTHIEAARVIEKSAIAKHFNYPDVVKDYIPSTILAFNASCYAVKNQGMVRKGLTVVSKEHDELEELQWRLLIESTNNFTKGGQLYESISNSLDLSPRNDSVTPRSTSIASTLTERKKLGMKFDW